MDVIIIHTGIKVKTMLVKEATGVTCCLFVILNA